jgi:uncharacterized membrane protein YjgN (DUF898 family)
MELTSTLLCPKCSLGSLTEQTCSHCGASFSPNLLESETDVPTSSDFTSSVSSLELQPEPHGQEDSDQVLPNGQDVPPPMTGTPKATDSSNTSIYHPIFWGRGQTLFGIFIVNTFYTLLTLGIYSFWGRVRIRQFLSSQTSLAKIRFSYHGTAQELIKGWSKAFLIFGIPYGILSLAPIIWEHIPSWIPNVLAAMMVLCFIPIAVVGSHRYRLSRTAFGAIRFSFRGQVKDYMKIWFTGTFLTFITAGVYYPFFENTRREFLVSHTYLGNQHFSYNGTGMALLGIYGKALGLIACVLLATVLMFVEISGIPLTPEFQNHLADWLNDEEHHSWLAAGMLVNVAALMWSWFYLQLSKQRYFWNHSAFGNAPFQFTASTWKLIELRVTNFLMLVLTFGLAWSWVQIRNLQFLYYYLGLQGPLDIHQIEQEALDASPTGEELAGYFDAGFDLG